MASVQEKLADSLSVLKAYQDTHENIIIQGMKTLGETHTKRLIQNGYLEQVIKGWYMPTMPGMEGDTTVWYASYWQFIVAYANNRFGTDWCLTPEESLDLYAGETVAPHQLILRSTKASNNIIQLKHGDSLLDITAAQPRNVVVEPRFGLRIYPLSEALVFCTPTYFTRNAVNARTCLLMVSSADEILKEVADEGNSSRASRLVGALRNVGRDDMAQKIQDYMVRIGHDMRPEDPFLDKVDNTLTSGRIISPYIIRIRLMWNKMKKQILALNPRKPGHSLSVDEILSGMEENYVRDSYHSLSIEGYRVTEGLIEHVRSGEWNPKNNKVDADRKNALAARGYYQAFLQVKESVKEILQEGNAGKIAGRDFEKWHFEMFQPCITAGIIKASDLFGYRTGQVYIRGSKHTPLSPDAVRDAMPVLMELMEEEDNAIVRAILGHFFFVYIHPYMDGNGRTARFLMNVMLVTGGYSWRIVTVEERETYMSALEKASIEGDITDFAKIIIQQENI